MRRTSFEYAFQEVKRSVVITATTKIYTVFTSFAFSLSEQTLFIDVLQSRNIYYHTVFVL